MSRRLKLLFAHVPKAGGSAVREALKAKFGERLLLDFDTPLDPTAEMNIDPAGFLERRRAAAPAALANCDAVTGHFWCNKYDGIAFEVRATILRHPVDRAISHYYFWLSSFDFAPHPVRSHVVATGMGLLDFVRLPITRGFYRDFIFRDTDMRRFDFIGDYRRLRTDPEGMMRELGVETALNEVNETSPLLTAKLVTERAQAEADAGLRSEVAVLLADEIRFFEGALSLRGSRTTTTSLIERAKRLLGPHPTPGRLPS